VRDELLNQHCFSSVRHAIDLVADWCEDYNIVRPHTSLGGLSPMQYLAAHAEGKGTRGELPNNPEPQPQTPRAGARATPEPVK
jgi:hypothetical protein